MWQEEYWVWSDFCGVHQNVFENILVYGCADLIFEQLALRQWGTCRDWLSKNQSKLLQNVWDFIGKSTSDKSLFHICDKLVHKQTVRTLWRKILLPESNVRLNSILLTFLIVEVHPPYLSQECFPLLPERKTVGYFSIIVPGIAEQCWSSLIE